MRAAAFVCLVVVVGCVPVLRCEEPVEPTATGCAVPDAPIDGGRDAPRIDARQDAPRDVPDASPVLDPMWVVPPGVPADCTVERATRPERLPGIAWEDCGAGCARADLGEVWNAVAGFERGDTVAYQLLSDDFGPTTRTAAITAVGGAILDAWRHVDSATTNCLMSHYAMGEGRVGVFVVYVGDPDAVLLNDLFWTYELAAGSSYVGPDIVFAPPFVGNSFHTQELAVSSELVAFRLGGGRIAVHHLGETREVFAVTADQGGFGVGASGDHVTFLDAGVTRRLMQWTPDRGTEVLYLPTDPIAYLKHDGTTLAWARLMDFVGGVATRAELWTGQLVRDPALFEPRLVNDRIEPDGELGGGLYGWTQTGPTLATEVHLIDLDTGRHRILPAPPEHGCQILHLSRDEVGLACQLAGHRWIYRYDPDIHATDL